MEYNSLGRSGLKISTLGLGSSQYSFFCQNDNLHTIRESLMTALNGGINYLDTSEQYGLGKSELIIGELMRYIPRDQFIIGTKVMYGGTRPSQKGLNHKHIADGLHNSLHRLQTDYVDILYCHGFDSDTPIHETVRAMDHLVHEGKIRYWGTSEWSRSQIEKAHNAARELNAVPPLVEQVKYNIFSRRRVEEEYAPLYPKFGMGLTTYYALYAGVLTGKYQEGIPKGSRIGKFQWLSQEGYLEERNLKTINELKEIAAELDCSLAKLAVAWCLKNEKVNSVIIGATNKDQIEENIRAISIKEKITESILGQINRAVRKFS